MNHYSPHRCPITTGVCGIAVIVAILAGLPFTTSEWKSFRAFTIRSFDVTEDGYVVFSTDRFERIRQGQLWRAITPSFIHLGLAHLLHNLVFVYVLTAPIEAEKGSLWMVVFMVVVGALSNVTQAYCSQLPYFGGMSMIWCAAIGYRSMWRWFKPGSPLGLPPWLLALGFAGVAIGILSGLEPIASYRPDWFPRIANGAHIAGLVTGMAFGLDTMFSRILIGKSEAGRP